MNILKSICSVIPPIHKEGYVFILGFLLVSVILGYVWAPLFWLGLVLTLWCAFFFRDPVRVTPKNADFIVSPADGIISCVGPYVPPADLGLGNEEMLRISVFMNVFNVHVNRLPVTGVIEKIAYRPGQFMNAELDKASEENERNGMVIATSYGKIALVQVAGLVARRILCWVKEGEASQIGERFGLIRFGSRLDIYLPANVKPRVAVGQQAIAGETVFASFIDEKSVDEFAIH